MDDFENKLKALLNEQIDHETRAHRAAPPLRRVTQAPKRSRRAAPWLMPLIAAACVAGVVLGGVGVTQLVSDRGNPAATEAPGPTVNSTPRPTTSPTPEASTSSHPGATLPSSHPYATSSSAAPQRHVVTLDGAQISLPLGMTVQRTNNEQSGLKSWCVATTAKQSGCAVQLIERLAQDAVPVSVDAIGTGFGDIGEHTCSSDSEKYVPPTVTQHAGDRVFGGRAADWRQWDFTCASSSKTWRYEQYVVATATSWSIFSDSKDDSTGELMAAIAAYSTLPAQSRPLRLYDRGFLRSAMRNGSMVRITLDRVISDRDKNINNNPAVYVYAVPAKLFDSGPPTLGKIVSLESDGNTVTSIVEEG